MLLEEILPEIRKGRGFKRKTYNAFINDIEGVGVCGYEILKNDWELEPEKKLLSREDLEKAWDKVCCVKQKLCPASISELFDGMMKELGL